MPFDFERLEGWLVKKHSTERTMNFGRSTESRRWFKVTEVHGADATELILGYYSSQKVKEAKGFIYLQDVDYIETILPLSFIIHTTARDLTITCQTKPELRMWLEGLVRLCPKANIDKITENINVPSIRDGKENTSPSASPAGSPPRRNDEAKSSDDEGKTNEDGNDNRLRMPEKSASPDRTELKSMKYAEEDADAEEEQAKMRTSRGGGRSESEAIKTEIEGAPVDSREKASRLNSSRDREDHRINGFHPGAGSGATSRLHAHINNETAGDAVLKPPSKEMRSSKEIIPTSSSSSSLVKRTTTETTSSNRTSKTEWIEGTDVELCDDRRRGPRSDGASARDAEYYAYGPNIDELGNLEMAPPPETRVESPNRRQARSQALKENRRQSENFTGDSKEEGGKPRKEEGGQTKTLRKASDGLFGESQGKLKNRGIDDLLSSQSLQGSMDYKGYYEDDEDDHLDLAAEKRRIADRKAKFDAKDTKDCPEMNHRDSREVGALEIGGSAYRVPGGSSRSSSQSGTPRSRSNSILEQHLIERETRVSIPHPPSDEKPPYAQKLAKSDASPNNGDAKQGGDSKTTGGHAPGKVMSQPTTAPDVKMSSEQLAKYGIGQGVAADDNWLEDDFDS